MKFEVKPNKSYSSEANAVKAVLARGFGDLRYFITCTPDGRYFPVFLFEQGDDEHGGDALRRGVHIYFNVVG